MCDVVKEYPALNYHWDIPYRTIKQRTEERKTPFWAIYDIKRKTSRRRNSTAVKRTIQKHDRYKREKGAKYKKTYRYKNRARAKSRTLMTPRIA